MVIVRSQAQLVLHRVRRQRGEAGASTILCHEAADVGPDGTAESVRVGTGALSHPIRHRR